MAEMDTGRTERTEEGVTRRQALGKALGLLAAAGAGAGLYGLLSSNLGKSGATTKQEPKQQSHDLTNANLPNADKAKAQREAQATSPTTEKTEPQQVPGEFHPIQEDIKKILNDRVRTTHIKTKEDALYKYRQAKIELSDSYIVLEERRGKNGGIKYSGKVLGKSTTVEIPPEIVKGFFEKIDERDGELQRRADEIVDALVTRKGIFDSLLTKLRITFDTPEKTVIKATTDDGIKIEVRRELADSLLGEDRDIYIVEATAILPVPGEDHKIVASKTARVVTNPFETDPEKIDDRAANTFHELYKVALRYNRR